jgi:predicted AAA+ superfamily ATPase
MIIRKAYLKKIKPFVGQPMVKAITGVRRVGKSFFIRQLMQSLRDSGVPERNLVSVDMESLRFDAIRTYQDLHAHVDAQIKKARGKVYVFIDEIQDIVDWERTVAAWMGDANRFDVTITGSNSTLFSGGLATRLTGRYIEFPIYPLAFPEYREFRGKTQASDDDLFADYLRYGGMPGIHVLKPFDDETVMPYLDAIYNTILLKDVVERHQIRNTALLSSIGRYTFDNIGNLLSANRISAYLKSQRVAANVQSVVNYLAAMTDAQLVFRVPRYDIRGKRHLEINDKFYATDLGLRHSQIGFRDGDISGIMENLVYVELRRRGYRVSVGQWGTQEVDFVAEKNGSPRYFQVTLHLDAPAVVARETSPLLAITDNYPKTIITLDRIHGDSIEGIGVTSLVDFLCDQSGPCV